VAKVESSMGTAPREKMEGTEHGYFRESEGQESVVKTASFYTLNVAFLVFLLTLQKLE